MEVVCENTIYRLRFPVLCNWVGRAKAILEKAGGSTNSNLYSEILLAILDALSSSGGGSSQEIEAIKQVVAGLKKDKIDNPLTSDDDKIPGAKNGGVEWVSVGQPTDKQTDSAVTKWLDEHPEATTTVKDGSITKSKIHNTFLKSICYPIFDTFPTENIIAELGLNAIFYTRGFYKKTMVAQVAISFTTHHI